MKMEQNGEESGQESDVNWSLSTICEKAIFQNQSLAKMHPIIM